MAQFIVITPKNVWRVNARSVQRLTKALNDLKIRFLSVTPISE